MIPGRAVNDECGVVDYREDYKTVMGRHDRQFCCYIEATENMKHFE